MKVLITDCRYSDPARDYHPYRETVTAAGGDLVYGEYETEDEVVAGVSDADVVVTYRAPMTRRVIDAMEDCRLIVRNAAGYDIVDIRAATEADIPVVSLRGYGNEELAEGAITLMLAASRDLVWADRDVRESPGFGERKSTNVLHGRTLGVVGLGNIGQAIVPKARGLGMEVIATDPYVTDGIFHALDLERVDFDELLARADVVSPHCQLNHGTLHLFGADEFAAMKDAAIFVNTARGRLVDEAALVDAVESGEIWGAGIDVYESEPPVDSPALECDRVICSPHRIGGDTEEQRERGLDFGRAHIRRTLAGKPPRHVINTGAIKHRGGVLNPAVEDWR